jgi:hypothetical protein
MQLVLGMFINGGVGSFMQPNAASGGSGPSGPALITSESGALVTSESGALITSG